MAEYNMYLEAYKLGLVDDVEVLKKTEIYDKEGVLQRKGMMSKMQSYIQQLEGQIKELSGDLQTADREAVHAKKQVITEKFKTDLKEISSDAKYKERVKLGELEKVIDKADVRAEAALAIQKANKGSSSKKGSAQNKQ